MLYEIDEDFGGVPQGHLYHLDKDSDDDFKRWRSMQGQFAKYLHQFKPETDYGFPEWHYEMCSLSVYLYNENIYNADFVPAVVRILTGDKPSYAEFECFDATRDLMGHFMVFKEKVIFSPLCQKSGLISKLFPCTSEAA